jgi:5-methylcytosine-specific restriction endonuclease McrA
MSSSYKGRRKSRWPKKTDKPKPVEEVIGELRKNIPHETNYRERSLKIHGLICAKCGREFDHKTSHLLTVHHKDGNSQNNPADGSNWENLCVYCHDDEHSRGLLGDYLNNSKK